MSCLGLVRSCTSIRYMIQGTETTGRITRFKRIMRSDCRTCPQYEDANVRLARFTWQEDGKESYSFNEVPRNWTTDNNSAVPIIYLPNSEDWQGMSDGQLKFQYHFKGAFLLISGLLLLGFSGAIFWYSLKNNSADDIADSLEPRTRSGF